MSNLVERVAQAIFNDDCDNTTIVIVATGERRPVDRTEAWQREGTRYIRRATAAIAVVGAEVADLTKHNLALEDELQRVREMLRATSAQDEREASNKGRP